MTIKTSFIYPPIPNRNFDWHAYVDGHEENTRLQGWGSTKEAAIAYLKERIEEEDEEALAGFWCKHCFTDVDDEKDLDRAGMCRPCVREAAREFRQEHGEVA